MIILYVSDIYIYVYIYTWVYLCNCRHFVNLHTSDNMVGLRRNYVIGILCVIFTLLVLDQLYLQYQLSLPTPPFAHALHLDDVRQVNKQ